MKIGLVCPYNMFEHSGGVQQQVVSLAEQLEKKGEQVEIITPKPMGYRGEVPSNYILLGTSQRVRAGISTAGDLAFEIDGDEIDAVLEAEKFDVINFHEPWIPVLARQIALKSTAAHVGTFHANFDDRRAAKTMVSMLSGYGRGIARRMHLITAVSPAAASVLQDRAPDHELVKNIRFIPNGINLSRYKPLKKRVPLSGPATKTIVYIGRLEARKGVAWLIKAFAALSEEMPNVHLVIAGDGALRSSLRQQVRTLNLRNVKFMGYVSEEKKRNLMGNADVICAPSLYGESFGIVLIEAMAMGTPLLAGNNSGYINVMTGHGRLGLVDPKSTVDFANRLSVFLTDEQLRKSMIEWCLKEVKKYDYTKVVAQYEAAYKEALVNWRVERHINGGNGKHVRIWQIRRRLALRRQSG